MSAAEHPSVLIVDDEPEILFSLTRLLRDELTVHTAASGTEALELLARAPVSTVLTDQRMPQMSGVQLLARIREKYPDTVRLVFTGYADIRAVIDAINLGHVYRYITKPWDPDELVTVLRQACQLYEEGHRRRRLLEELREAQLLGLRLVEGLERGTLGGLSEAGQREAAALRKTGSRLLASLARELEAGGRGSASEP